ncbi:MAG TPA: efflux RND transporter periplasmic adaptor subunit, partial [Methylotenera sp.]|nr:efflux RND transporter periplasmic adaptor subunit [Methylotenera sp.]
TMNGAVSAWQEAQVSAEIGGLRIKQVLVDVGSQVKRGQDLALLADETVLADLHKQQATVARDRSNLAEAKSNADRARQIKDSGALSTQQINQYVIAEETAQANLNLSLAELDNQQIRLRQTHVTAADDGVISSRSANLGNVVAVGGELFRLIRQGRIEWRGEVNAQQLALIKVGQKVNLTLPDNRQVTGTVRMKAPTVDVNTRNALVYVDLPKASAEPGMYAQGTINIGTKPALAVPQTALVLRDGRSYLYEVQTATNTANALIHRVIQRSVTTGRREGDLVEISEGITEDAQLVVTGGAFLNDGDLVKVVNAQKTSNNDQAKMNEDAGK